MAGYRLTLPTIQNWNCHSCAGCCRQHAIEVTAEERERIAGQNWTAADGVDPSRPLWVASGPPWARTWRLAHQQDGGCVFLNEDGLCRIHAKFGEAAKPLACRIYPYAFHPAGKEVRVSLRYSCPSVVENRGDAVDEQPGELKRTARLVVPDDVSHIPPPPVAGRQRVDWPDFLRLVDALEDTLAGPEGTIIHRLLQACFWLKLAGGAKYDDIRGDRIDELAELLQQEAEYQFPADSPLADIAAPSRTGRIQFRLLVARHARKDTAAEASPGWRQKWSLLRAALKFSAGRGTMPVLQPGLEPVQFEQLEPAFGGLPPGAEDLFTRYFRIKVQGLHFCGAAFYNMPLVEGFYSLATMLPIVLYLARWLAAGEQRNQLTLPDVRRALAMADHHFGYLPDFGQRGMRRAVRLFAASDDLTRLIAWYSR
ncbi:MAG: YkgJ family cysteine cluster protein [Planctomycetaceae bacterium]|nr:YkgJ family cysteine cluster protein [Planctomycetaceae bacterium]